MLTDRIFPVILSGGSGTRLWPLSRTSRPKQLLGLTHAETMLQLTALRTADHPTFHSPLIVGNAAHAEEIETQLREAHTTHGTLILEPAGRNTAPAIALAAFALPLDAMMLVMPSDHVIADVPAFLAAVEAASSLAADGWLTTLGITPDQPEVGYGYIARGEALLPGVFRVIRFVEKPDKATAEAYLATGQYSWNGGIFVFTAGAYISALETHAPAIADAAREAVQRGAREDRRIYPDAAAFRRSPSVSIDYAVMEKAERVAVVPVDMGWSDVGSWDALYELASKDNRENAIHGEVIAIDTAGCLIRSAGPVVTAVGISEMIVIATSDAVLILPRRSSQDVKRVVEQLKLKNHSTLDRAT